MLEKAYTNLSMITSLHSRLSKYYIFKIMRVINIAKNNMEIRY